jgi:hypothetical protein
MRRFAAGKKHEGEEGGASHMRTFKQEINHFSASFKGKVDHTFPLRVKEK